MENASTKKSKKARIFGIAIFSILVIALIPIIVVAIVNKNNKDYLYGISNKILNVLNKASSSEFDSINEMHYFDQKDSLDPTKTYTKVIASNNAKVAEFSFKDDNHKSMDEFIHLFEKDDTEYEITYSIFDKVKSDETIMYPTSIQSLITDGYRAVRSKRVTYSFSETEKRESNYVLLTKGSDKKTFSYTINLSSSSEIRVNEFSSFSYYFSISYLER